MIALILALIALILAPACLISVVGLIGGGMLMLFYLSLSEEERAAIRAGYDEEAQE